MTNQMTNPDCGQCEEREWVWGGVSQRRESLSRDLKKGNFGLPEKGGSAYQASVKHGPGQKAKTWSKEGMLLGRGSLI